MRRTDREVKGFEDIVAIMEKCDVCRIALNNNGYPYILPLNFGMYIKEDKIELYFHGAMEGTKYDLIEKDNRASFEMDCGHKLVTEAGCGSCTMNYESVIGQGHIEMLSDDEKYNALYILMKHYHQEEFPFNKAVIPNTKVFKLVVEKVTGKIRVKKLPQDRH
ncbi:MAG: pyridoxamine 5'-phosphate oxidase family protein [Lachnospiraceae bacterium]